MGGIAKQLICIEKGQVIEKFDTFFTAMVDSKSGKKIIKRIDFEEVSDKYLSQIAVNAKFEIHYFREIYQNGKKLRCVEIVFGKSSRFLDIKKIKGE